MGPAAFIPKTDPFITNLLFKEELAVLDFDETTHAFVSPQKQNPPDEEVADIYQQPSLRHPVLHGKCRTQQSRPRRFRWHRFGGQCGVICFHPAKREYSPCQYAQCLQLVYDQRSGTALADNIGCYYTVIPVQESLELTRKQFREAVLLQKGEEKGHLQLTSFIEENIQARDRSSRILSPQQPFGGVFTCNANKAESSVGYATLYGDHAGFLAPQPIYGSIRYMLWPVSQRCRIPARSRPPGQYRHRAQCRIIGQDITKGQEIPSSILITIISSALLSNAGGATPETILTWYKEGTLEKEIGRSVNVRDIFPRQKTSSTIWNGGGVSCPVLPSPNGFRARRSFPSAAAPLATTCANPS